MARRATKAEAESTIKEVVKILRRLPLQLPTVSAHNDRLYWQKKFRIAQDFLTDAGHPSCMLATAIDNLEVVPFGDGILIRYSQWLKDNMPEGFEAELTHNVQAYVYKLDGAETRPKEPKQNYTVRPDEPLIKPGEKIF